MEFDKMNREELYSWLINNSSRYNVYDSLFEILSLNDFQAVCKEVERRNKM